MSLVGVSLLLMLSIACDDAPTKETKGNVVSNNEVISRATRSNLDVEKFQYNGHSYILFSGSHYANGVVHDPDCPCFKR